MCYKNFNNNLGGRESEGGQLHQELLHSSSKV